MHVSIDELVEAFFTNTLLIKALRPNATVTATNVSTVMVGNAGSLTDVAGNVDIIDLSTVGESFRNKVLREGIAWNA